MKDVIELLEKTVLGLEDSLDGLVNVEKIPAHYIEIEYIEDAITSIDKVIAELKTPRWYTPEKWEAETGEPWPDNGAVYLVERGTGGWRDIALYGSMYNKAGKLKKRHIPYESVMVICATEAGPPPDNWDPEIENAKS